MDDLIAFLRARLDEREAKANAANVKQDDPTWFVSPVLGTWPHHFKVRSERDNLARKGFTTVEEGTKAHVGHLDKVRRGEA